MKKLNKLGTIALSTAVMATSIFASPVAMGSVSADTDTTGSVMTIDRLLSNYECDANGKVTIPVAKAVNGGTAETKIYPLYSDVAVEATEADGKLSFVPQFSAYRVVYSIGGVEKSFVINIELTKPVMSFETNGKVFLPSVTEKDYTLTIPYPEIKDADGNDILNLSGTAYTKAELAAKTTIKVYAPNGTLLTDTEADTSKPVGTVEQSDKTYADSIKYLKFTPKAFGSYTIKYVFQTDNTTSAELTKVVEVRDAFETKRDISFALSKSIGSPVIGEEFTLPTPTVTDETNDVENIEAYTDITVKVVKKDGTTENVEVNGFKFTPLIEGDYIVTYKVTDVYGNSTSTASYQISNVKDTKAPFNVKLVDSYEFTDADLDKKEDYSYKLQSRMKTSVDGDESTYLVIPAVYAEDNDPAKKLENFVVTRTVKSYSSSTSAVTIDEKFNKTSLFKVERAGTYTVTYTIYDKQDGNKTEVSYQVVVQDNFTDTVVPEITFDTAVATSAKAGDVIKFKKPTTVDYRDENKNTGDTRLNLKTYYYTDSIDNKVLINEDKDDSTKLSFTIPADFSGTLKIVTYSTDDSGNTATYEKSINVVNDTVAPTFAQIEDFETSYTQGTVISIPKVKVADNYAKSVTANIEVTNASGEKVQVSGLNYEDEAGVKVLFGASFYAVQSGEYQIKYTVRDGSDNVAIFTKKINVTRTTTPIIKVDEDLITAEIGDEIDLNIFTVTDDGKLVDPNDIEITGVAVDENNKFKPLSTGEYTAKFVYKYTVDGVDKVAEKTITIKVQDTTAPVLSFDGETFSETAYKPNVEITLPTPVVTDNSGCECALDVKIEYNSEEVTFDKATMKFTPANTGNYTISYTATDDAGNSTVKEFSITVGDKTGPIINLGDESVNAPSKMKVGSTFTLDISKISIYDEYEGQSIAIDGGNVTITLRNPNGDSVSKISPNGYSWKLDKVGTYTLTYVAKDSSGNRTTITKNIEVSDETKAEENVGDTGMVLAIIAALVVLAGVIFFFFKPEKKSNGNNKNKKLDK